MKTFRIHLLPLLLSTSLAQERNLVTDEPVFSVGKPEGAPEYVAKVEPHYGQHLALTLEKLETGLDRPFLIWALGSSYTNMLGDGGFWKEEIPKRFPKIREVEYRKMVGNSCPWQYLRGWARHLVVPDQPDLVIIYTIGDPADLEKLLVEFTSRSGQIWIVPNLWRRAERNRSGETFTFEVLPAAAGKVDFRGDEGEAFTVRLAEITASLAPMRCATGSPAGLKAFSGPTPIRNTTSGKAAAPKPRFTT